jgi:hypothetical protein
MPTLSDLLSAIDAVFGLSGTNTVLHLNSATKERAFEAYVLSLVVTAVRQAGGQVVMHGAISGPNPVTVVFRGAPGLLGSIKQDFAFARCQLGSKEFELHIDVQYEGSSGAVHEIDVSIYDRWAADQARRSPTLFPKTNKLRGVIECKFYEATMGTNLGRTFVGLVDDCGALYLKLFATNGYSAGLVRYFSPRRRPDRSFRLSPLRPNEEREFVTFVSQILSKWAGVA